MSEVKSNKYTDNETGNAAGMMQLIQTISASNDATIDFTTGIDSTYDTYVVKIVNLNSASDDVNLRIRVLISGTPETGASDYAYDILRVTAGTVTSSNSNSDSILIMTTGGIGSNAGRSYSGSFEFYNPSSTSEQKHFIGKGVYTRANGVQQMDSFGGRYTDTVAFDGIRIFLSSGNIASGEFSLYGIKK